MNKVYAARPPLYAKPLMVGRTVGGFHIHYPVVLHHKIELTAGSAVGTGRAYPRDLPAPEIILSFQSKCAGRANACTVPAVLTAGIFPAFAERCLNGMISAAVSAFQYPVAGDIVTYIYAALTVNTLSGVVPDIWVIIYNTAVLTVHRPGAAVRRLLHAETVAKRL